MKEIKFIDVKSELDGFGAFKGNRYVFPEIKPTIEKMIKNGWDYAGNVPLVTRGVGDIEKISLIFQREKSSKNKDKL